MHLRILPDHQKLFLKKVIIESLEWLKTCFYAFAHTSRSPETFFQKRNFDRLEWFWHVLMHFRLLPDHQKLFSKKIFFTTWSGYKRVLMHFHILPEKQKLFFKRDIFYCLEQLQTCFDAFSQTSIPPETFFQKRYFLLSEVVKNVFLCICAYFPITRNILSEKIFFTVWCG